MRCDWACNEKKTHKSKFLDFQMRGRKKKLRSTKFSTFPTARHNLKLFPGVRRGNFYDDGKERETRQINHAKKKKKVETAN